MPTIEEIKSWQRDPVTVEFFDRVSLHREDADLQVHKSLEDGEQQQAALHNASMVVFEEVLDITGRMIDELKEGDDET